MKAVLVLLFSLVSPCWWSAESTASAVGSVDPATNEPAAPDTAALDQLSATESRAAWLTPFELSNGLRTPRYAETVTYCQKLAEASPQISYCSFGTSPQGRDLPLLIVNREGHFTPEAVRQGDDAVVLIQACIHAGESCGKDAGLMLLREMTVGRRQRDLLDHVTVLFVPIFNVDGHERFGPYNRINQNGPEEMGWRTTAQNLNLNRDYLKADAPEMRAWLALWQAWLPDFLIDTHSTDGADYQYVLTYSMETHGNLDEGVTGWVRDSFVPALEGGMAAAGYPLSPYVMFRRWHDPTSGLKSWVARPGFSQGYAAVQNRPGLMVEAHMMKDYRTRVEGVQQMLRQCLQLIGHDHDRLRSLVLTADAYAASADFRQQPLPLQFAATPDSVMIDFLGVDFEEVQSEITGGSWFRYGSQPRTYKVPFFNNFQSSVSVDLPAAYIIPREWAEVAERLRWHGVELKELTEPSTLKVRSYRLLEPSWEERPYEGRQRVSFQLEPFFEKRTFAAGSWVVDMRQRVARLIAHALEPQGPDSFACWGFFDAVLAQVEYVESYVIEEMAHEMLAADADLSKEYEAKQNNDPEWAANPWAIRQWFYQQTPYHDRQMNTYPIGLVGSLQVLGRLRNSGP